LIYVVLGMHKSGTTLVSQILHNSGINMGDDIDTEASYDQGNKYERASVLALNKDILGLSDNRIIDLEAPDTLQLTEDQRARMQAIIQRCNGAYVDWGFKDPRTALLYPLWASELPEHRIIAVYRSPSELWVRYRYKRIHYHFRNLSRAWKLMKRWCEHNSRILAYLQNTKADSIVLSYQELMTSDVEFNRLQAFVGKTLDDKRDKSMYRGREGAYPLLRTAEWLVHKQTGDTPEAIIGQFEALRRVH